MIYILFLDNSYTDTINGHLFHQWIWLAFVFKDSITGKRDWLSYDLWAAPPTPQFIVLVGLSWRPTWVMFLKGLSVSRWLLWATGAHSSHWEMCFKSGSKETWVLIHCFPSVICWALLTPALLSCPTWWVKTETKHCGRASNIYYFSLNQYCLVELLWWWTCLVPILYIIR